MVGGYQLEVRWERAAKTSNQEDMTWWKKYSEEWNRGQLTANPEGGGMGCDGHPRPPHSLNDSFGLYTHYGLPGMTLGNGPAVTIDYY